MTRDGQYIGVVDRFEDDRAVVLVEEDGETVDEVVLEREELPGDGRHVDAVLSLEFASGSLEDIDYLPERTEDRQTAAQRRFDQLSQRPPGQDSDGTPE